ncbi:MAG: precorrin-6y C5,15-methyltransferase (decarboxylating) subunit CbiE, partial [Nitrospirae bacterium]
EYEKVKDRVLVHERFTEMMQYLRERIEKGQDVVLLGSGDPLFFGIGRRLLREFGPEKVEILPDLSSMQVAAAKAGIPWDDAFFMSLHGGPIEGQRRQLPYDLEHIPALLNRYKKIVILTDSEYNPKRIANALKDKLPFSTAFYVCQKMGYPDEKVEKLTLEDASERDFQEPNLVIIIKEDEHYRDTIFGLTEEDITHKRGLITKDEIRAVSIHKLRLPYEGVLWDIGAGSGAVSIEAAKLSLFLKVYAIEKDPEMIETLRENINILGTPNIEIIETEAPQDLDQLPPPDRVFIGGSGGRLREIIEKVSEVMKEGVVVINLSRIELIKEAMDALTKEGFQVDISQVSVSRGSDLGGLTYLKALNPVFILRGQR